MKKGLAGEVAGSMTMRAACSGQGSDDGGGGGGQFVVLAEDVPGGLDPDGPSGAIPASQAGIVNLMEPLIGYQLAGAHDDRVQLYDFKKFEGRLAESFSFDEKTLSGQCLAMNGAELLW